MSETPGWMLELRAGQDLVTSLRARGLTLRLVDGQPRIGPAELVDEEVRALLADHRSELLVALRWERPA
jgi:hypothetical protein